MAGVRFFNGIKGGVNANLMTEIGAAKDVTDLVDIASEWVVDGEVFAAFKAKAEALKLGKEDWKLVYFASSASSELEAFAQKSLGL